MGHGRPGRDGYRGRDRSRAGCQRPAACRPAARDRVLGRGDPLTRDSLAAQLRRDGHPVRNARISQVLTTLKLESRDAPAAYAAEERILAGTGRLAPISA